MSSTALAEVTLDDKYLQQEGRVFVSGNQVLVRLAIQQRLRDAAAGRNTAGYVSGYRGSPLGRFDMEMWAAAPVLEAHHIHFRAAVNEDLAATALWGSQYVGSFAGAKYDGVFGIWYGKGPGVDRSGDVFRHANSAGTSALGGVLAIAGDDHGAKSSTITNFSDQIFTAVGMPLLYPSNAQEVLEFGLHGIALSRYSGCWVGMKVVTDIIEGGGTIDVGLDRPAIKLPDAGALPAQVPGGRSIRLHDPAIVQEDRLYNHKLHAAMAYIRANGLNRVTHDAAAPRVGVIAAGKAYQDVLQALCELGLSGARCNELGLRVAKVGAVWPLDPQFVRDFAAGLDVILVVEEKRALLENQVKSALYDAPHAGKPRVVGKFDGASEWDAARGVEVLSRVGELAPPQIAKALADCLRSVAPDCVLQPVASGAAPGAAGVPIRPPTFCSGCPHNRSTRVPEGSRALAGIGCHTIAMFQNPAQTATVSHMGGEGAMWFGQQPFTTEKHVFANMGDGTYFHSGFLAIRQAVAAKVPITYKLLINGFVSMTGGQPVDGELTLARMVAEVAAEGVRQIAVVTDDPERIRALGLPPGVPIHHRTELDAVQRQLREYPDVSVLFYDQPCATERRRLRKRGKWADPDRRSFINTAVCEGCGDCGKASNCLSIEPVETPFGRKRRINQASCNKDFSCIEGFCPSFVTVHGGRLRKAAAPAAAGSAAADLPPLPEPRIARPDAVYSILVTGIGGTGVVTIGQIVGMAAHLDGLASSILDVTGLAQKYGAVMSHVRLSADSGALHATRIAAGEADAIIGCDLVVTAGDEALSRARSGRTRVALSTDLTPTGDFARNPDWQADPAALLRRIEERCGASAVDTIESIRIATSLLGDPIAANMFMLGLAWQRGWVPVSRPAIERAIELNGVRVEFNRTCFEWGRRAAHDRAAVEKRSAPAANVVSFSPRETVERIVATRVEFLTAYRDAAYAQRYRGLVTRVMDAERAAGCGDRLSRAVARCHFKLLAIKDEWEVARLYAGEEFRRELESTFDGDYTLRFHLGAWPFARADPTSGLPVKGEVGPWVLTAFRWMARLRRLRGTWLDPFRNSPDRQLDRRLLAGYEADVESLIAGLDAAGYERAVCIASLPDRIRGYGHVRAAAAEAVARERADLMRAATPAARAA
jgi:indolepyruvate ferredoxin oxidoreductase